MRPHSVFKDIRRPRPVRATWPACSINSFVRWRRARLPRRRDMKIAILCTTLLFTLTAHAATPAAPAAPAAKAHKAAPPAAPKEQLQEVTYEDAVKYLNQRIVVHTTLRTERRGTLVKYSGTAID